MPKATVATLPQRVRKMTRRQSALHANEVRWARERAKHYDNLYQLRAQMLTALSSLAELARELPDEKREASRVALTLLAQSYHQLWQFSGHDLPVRMRDYAAGVIDELHRQAAVKEAQPI